MAYRYGDRHQKTLFPKSIDEYIPNDAPVRAYDVIIDSLDFDGLGIKIDPHKVGCPEYDPKVMLKLLVYGYGHKSRVFKMLPIGRRKVELVVNKPRLYCKDCDTIRQPHLAFSDPKKHDTRSLERFVVDLCRIMSIQDVAELTCLGWD